MKKILILSCLLFITIACSNKNPAVGYACNIPTMSYCNDYSTVTYFIDKNDSSNKIENDESLVKVLCNLLNGQNKESCSSENIKGICKYYDSNLHEGYITMYFYQDYLGNPSSTCQGTYIPY